MKNQYAHMLWIGGAPCSGKSSIADRLAGRYRLAVYHVDDMFDRYRQVTREQDPYLFKWTHTPWEDLWMQPSERLLQEAIGCYGEQFEMVVRDLRERSRQERILVEGCSLLPDRVAELMGERAQGIWIVPTEEFQRVTYRARGAWVEGILEQCKRPERAYQNWMDRDVAFGR